MQLGVVREVLSLQLESGQAVQACVTLTQLNSSGGTQAAQALSGSSKVIPSVVGFTTRPWTPAGNTMAAAKLTDGLWKLQRHLRITAVALQDIESASFHAVSESFPVIPKLQEALTSRPPHVILLPHPSFDFEKLSSLIERLESGFQDVEVLGVVPLPPLPDQDLPTAKKQLESFRSEAGVILAEANAADDLAAPLAVAAAEAENLTLDQLGKKKKRKGSTSWHEFYEKPKGAAPEEAVSTGQEEAAVFREDTSFMQGVVGLTLMPSTTTTRVPHADLAALACLVFGSDKLYGFFLSNNLKRHVYMPQEQQSSIAPPSQEDTSTTPLLTEADLAQFTTKPKLTTPSSPQSPLSHYSESPASSLALKNQDPVQSPQPDSPDAQAAPLPVVGEIGAPLLQTPTQLPVFAVDSVLWPNQIMMLRVFEPRYRRLVKCCQETNGCFALACYGVGISAIFDRVHTEEDASNSVTIRGGRRFLVQEGSARVVPGAFGLTVVEPTYIYDKDINSPEVATLAAQAADLLTMAHAAAVEDAANSQGGDITSDEEAPEDAASRWREGVLEDAGASSSFASVFNLDTKVRQSSSATVAAVRQDWSPAASQELSFLLGSALPVPPTMRRRWLKMTSLVRRLTQQVELLREPRPRVILGGILQGLPDDSRFHELLYNSDINSE
ncbi:MAG: hypothetical protein FRX49_04250 [Trebouxia sp. A1-2]|nr:MAG: hypothetical protein FRX49_04250 [Trebouxia sp. A1-2]